MEYKYLRIGKIVNTQGIKGEVRVIPLTDDITRFDDLKYVYLDDEKLIKMDIESVKYHKNFVLLKFKGFESINDAEKIKNTYILVNRENAVKLPEDSYFVCDIIGMVVFDMEGNSLGKVEDVISTGSNDVYVVKREESQILIPALKSVVKSIDLKEGKIVVILPEGLV
jgi:16S rRNA processing protein RimM